MHRFMVVVTAFLTAVALHYHGPDMLKMLSNVGDVFDHMQTVDIPYGGILP